MHQILAEFLDKWVWPTAPGAPGAAFRLRITEEKCIKGWEMAVAATLSEIEKGLASGNEDWKRRVAMGGYAAEGVQMSIKQMSAQLVSVDIAEQERYIDLQRMRARQVWDECKHSKLHVEVLMEKGWIKSERDLLDNPAAHLQPLPAYFGLSMMFPPETSRGHARVSSPPDAREPMRVRIDYAICNSCGLCREVCPESAITQKYLEARHLYEVHPAKCTGCGDCLEYCPAPGALVQYAS